MGVKAEMVETFAEEDDVEATDFEKAGLESVEASDSEEDEVDGVDENTDGFLAAVNDVDASFAAAADETVCCCCCCDDGISEVNLQDSFWSLDP